MSKREQRQCAGSVSHGRMGSFPCSRPATTQGKDRLGNDKWWCWQHDPVRVKCEDERLQAKWEAESDASTKKWEREQAIFRAFDKGGAVREARDALAPLANLWDDSLERRGHMPNDATPIYGLNNNIITIGDIRKAQVALAELDKVLNEETPK